VQKIKKRKHVMNISSRLAFVTFAIVCLCSCVKDVGLNEVFYLDLGEQVQISEIELQIGFVGISDGRCAAFQECSGDNYATVEISVSGEMGAENIDIIVPPGDFSEVQEVVFDYEIVITQLLPAPTQGDQNQVDNYSIEIEVRRHFDLLDSYWQLEEISVDNDLGKIAGGHDYYLVFEESEVLRGVKPCNSFMGEFQLVDKRLSVNLVEETNNNCIADDPTMQNLMNKQIAVFDSVVENSKYSNSNGFLTLESTEGETLLFKAWGSSCPNDEINFQYEGDDYLGCILECVANIANTLACPGPIQEKICNMECLYLGTN
jgi:heat shock protein HslJ